MYCYWCNRCHRCFLVKYFQDKNWNGFYCRLQIRINMNSIKKINLMNKKIFKNCSVLIHCAYDFIKLSGIKLRINIDGSLELLKLQMKMV